MNGLNDVYVESIIKKAIAGAITTVEASAKLGVTRQYVNKLKVSYKKEGRKAFSHGNKGKDRAWKTDPATEARIVSLYRGKYDGFNFSHFVEKLNEDEGIKCTYRTVYRILTEAGIKSPKKHRAAKERAKHPSRPRRQGFGELLQIDASIHNWFGAALPKAALHGAIDDATGTVMGLWFDKGETLRGYYEMMWQILGKYGIPEALYGDRKSIFHFKKLSEKEQTVDRDVHINFKRMCQQLGIELITTSCSQAKGRNLPEFTADYNRRFAAKPDMEKSLFAPAPSPKEIDFYLSTEFQRVTDNGSSFAFQGKRAQLADDNGLIAKIPPKTLIDIYVTRSGKRVAVYKGKLWELVEVEKRTAEEKAKKPGRPRYIPGPDHPWRKFVIKKKNG